MMARAPASSVMDNSTSRRCSAGAVIFAPKQGMREQVASRINKVKSVGRPSSTRVSWARWSTA
eukprot:15170767-Heterocapsa_arctica.AAC.1